ncbi:SEC-C domain-containing protein [Paludisphaera soli]|uniref:SEC-C domain-containing protein n=1 Tax=Paludisphaera soli TaxID=2712865 RepID=UPI0013EC30CD|nr:SEC-C domain-containing protein [Paludisphaera soli]
MPAVDSYSPCPCGSGQKFKWCCHKAESYVDRAMRLERNGQSEAALSALNEGLAKLPDNPWLALRRAILLAVLDRTTESREAVDKLLESHPEHPGALSIKLRLLQASGEIRGAVDLFQDLLAKAVEQGKPAPAEMATALGATLYRAGFIPAALAHLDLVGDDAPAQIRAMCDELRTTIGATGSISPWLKNPYALHPCPADAGADVRERFAEAVAWAGRGLLERAAAAFELLSSDERAGRVADVNQGLCRLRLADHAGAVAAIRRGLASAPATTDAVDLEALCQLIDPEVGDDPIEEVELTWSLRDRDGLIRRLREDGSCVERPSAEQEPDEDATLEFALLDRPRIEDPKDVKPGDLPLVAGTILVEPDALKLESFDDGRLNGLIDRLAAIAGQTIPPAQPRTKILGPVSRQSLVLDVACQPPAGLPIEQQQRLVSELGASRVQERWVETPMAFLGGKTPAQAGRDGGFEVPLRAALTLLESHGDWSGLVDWDGLRARLGVPPEPTLDPFDVELDDVHLGRLGRVDPHGLDDERLVDLHARANAWGLLDVIARSAREIATRRRLLEREGFPTLQVFTELALDAAIRGSRDEALGWVRKGRESEPAARRPASAPSWDMLDVRVRTMFDEPEAWVPEVAAVMSRYEGDAAGMQKVLSHMIELGLIQLAPSPEDPSKYVADPSMLYSLLMRYGPRVQAVGGAPAGGGIWTPGAPAGGAGGGSGLWTPGSSGAETPADKPRIILPGR